MTISRRTTLALGAGMLAMMTGTVARAAGTVVTVNIWDSGEMDMSDMNGMVMMGLRSGADMTKATAGIKIDMAEVKAGEVTFAVTNSSEVNYHEMVVAPMPADGADFPYEADENKVDEDGANPLGEVAELEPGAAGEVTLTLEPGQYVLFCNIPGHYSMGMWTVLTVTA